ncbi:hypothetical protein D083_1702 [Dickeya solani RNS 08.23.3.1.A]|nr:hypothetical protein D083_1702 [Dickeya solani RNS 08.23.3.1.A]
MLPVRQLRKIRALLLEWSIRWVPLRQKKSPNRYRQGEKA